MVTRKTHMTYYTTGVTWAKYGVRATLTNVRVLFVVFLLLTDSSLQCGPGRGGGRRRSTRRMTPLVYKQHIPNVSENTLGASGQAEGRIDRRKDPEAYNKLVVNMNPDISFKNEEGTGEDRLMSPRCKDKLNRLAVSVANQWPGLKLRVTEAYDTKGHHADNSLHYEGRAVDITVNGPHGTTHRSKYGMLARLAVNAGFDWVYYESRGHIHCSVKSESSEAVRIGGCFPAESTVATRDGPVKMSDLRVGDSVMTLSQNGSKVYTEVISFMHRLVDQVGSFLTLYTENGDGIRLTNSHYIYVHKARASQNNNTFTSKNDGQFFDSLQSLRAVFARDVFVGDFVYSMSNATHGAKLSRVVDIQTRWKRGIFAPLTYDGNMLVDGVLVSCYALVADYSIPHRALAPYRALYTVTRYLLPKSASRFVTGDNSQVGIHWYAWSLYKLGQVILPNELLLA